MTRCNPTSGQATVTAESITATYSFAHEAFGTLARANDLQPVHLRVLVALLERGGSGRTDQLEVELQCEGSFIRRAYPVLAARGLLLADAGEGTLRPKRGVRARLSLTAAGRSLAELAVERAQTGLSVAA